MIPKIIIALAAIYALFQAYKVKKPIPGMITLGMVASMAIVLFSSETVMKMGFYGYMGFVALAFAYGLLAKDKNAGERIIICLMCAGTFGYWLWVMNHWHGMVLVAPIIVFITSLYGLSKKFNLKVEFSFLVIMVADAFAILVESWMKAG